MSWKANILDTLVRVPMEKII